MRIVLSQLGVLLVGFGLGFFIILALMKAMFGISKIQEIFAPNWDEFRDFIQHWFEYKREQHRLWKERRDLNDDMELAIKAAPAEDENVIRARYAMRAEPLQLQENENEARAVTLADSVAAVAMAVCIMGRLVFAGFVLGLMVYGLISISMQLPYDAINVPAW